MADYTQKVVAGSTTIENVKNFPNAEAARATAALKVIYTPAGSPLISDEEAWKAHWAVERKALRELVNFQEKKTKKSTDVDTIPAIDL